MDSSQRINWILRSEDAVCLNCEINTFKLLQILVYYEECADIQTNRENKSRLIEQEAE